MRKKIISIFLILALLLGTGDFIQVKTVQAVSKAVNAKKAYKKLF